MKSLISLFQILLIRYDFITSEKQYSLYHEYAAVSTEI